MIKRQVAKKILYLPLNNIRKKYCGLRISKGDEIMAIMPVSSISLHHNTRNDAVSFGKKNSERLNQERVSTPMIKAVPLAVLIAMSPLNSGAIENTSQDAAVNNIELLSENAQNNIKLVHEESPVERSRFQFYSKTNNKKSIDEVVLRMTGYPFDVKRLVNTTIEIVGDDGFSAGEIKFPQLILEPISDNSVVMGDSNPERCEYVQNFLDGKLSAVKNNNAISVQDVKRKVRFGNDCELQNVAPSTSWLDEGATVKEAFGIEVGHLDVKTENGNYRVTVYDLDESRNDFEVVTIKRENGPEFKVSALRGAKIKMEDFGDKIADLSIGVIEVNKRHSDKTAKLVNNELFEALAGLMRDTGYNKAFQTSLTNSVVSVLNGVVYPKN